MLRIRRRELIGKKRREEEEEEEVEETKLFRPMGFTVSLHLSLGLRAAQVPVFIVACCSIRLWASTSSLYECRGVNGTDNFRSKFTSEFVFEDMV
jgi:hypothetical protein